jgi:hypothetical protein
MKFGIISGYIPHSRRLAQIIDRFWTNVIISHKRRTLELQNLGRQVCYLMLQECVQTLPQSQIELAEYLVHFSASSCSKRSLHHKTSSNYVLGCR